MANTIPSPDMNLPVPVVDTDPGPDWANNLNSCLSIIDGHTHNSGSGVQITPQGINVNSDFPFNNNNATTLRTVRFTTQTSTPATASDLGCLYESGVDLYYIDGAGNNVRITQGGSVTGATGTITGLPSGTASAAYSAGVFTFQSATNTPATMSVGSVIIAQQVASGKGVTIAASGSQASNYNLTLPSALPSTPSFFLSDTSGNISFLPNNGNVRGSEGGGTVTLTISDNKTQVFNLSSNETVKLPTTGVYKGEVWQMVNPNGFKLTVEASDASVIVKSWGSNVKLVALVNTPVASTDWAVLEHTVLFGTTYTTYTPSYPVGAVVAGSTIVQWSRPNIETMQVHASIVFGPGSSGSAAFTFGLPLSLAAETSLYPTVNTLGTAIFKNSGGTYWGVADVVTSSTVGALTSFNATGVTLNTLQNNFLLDTNVLVTDVFVKILEWAVS